MTVEKKVVELAVFVVCRCAVAVGFTRCDVTLVCASGLG